MLDLCEVAYERTLEHTGSLPSHLIFAARHLEQAATGRLTLRRGVSRTMSPLPLLAGSCGLETVMTMLAQRLETT